MDLIADPSFHMWFVLAMTLFAILLFLRDEIPLEITSIALLTVLLLFGQLFPLSDANGKNQLDSMTLLSGFANPSLISIGLIPSVVIISPNLEKFSLVISFGVIVIFII